MSSTRTDVVVLVFEDGGGMSHYARNLAEGLRAHGSVEVVGIAGDVGLEQGPWAPLLDSFHVGRRLRRVYDTSRFRRIVRDLCSRYRPTVVHVASSVPCMGAVADELRRQGVLAVHTIHDPAPHRQTRSLWSNVQTAVSRRWLWPRALCRFDVLHVHSHKHRELLAACYPRLTRKRMYVVQHGGGATREVANGDAMPAELASPLDRARTVLFFGRIEDYKGLDVLLAALGTIAQEVPGCRLIVAGAGRVPHMPDGVRDRVILINRFIADAEIAAIFGAASVIVLPYRSGSQTGVIPLASAFALPAVVTRVGALDELVRDNETGYVVAPLDPAVLARAVVRLLLTPELAVAMGRAARRFMEEHFSWSAVAARHWDLYRDASVKRPVTS